MARGYTNTVGSAEEIGSITYKDKSNDPNYLLCDGSNTNQANFLGFNIGNMDTLDLPSLSYQSWISSAFYYNESIYCVQSPVKSADAYPSILWESRVNDKKSWVKRREQIYKSALSNVPNMCPANIIGDVIVMPHQSGNGPGAKVRLDYSADGGKTWINGQSFSKITWVETILYSCTKSNVMIFLTKQDPILSTTDGKNWVSRSTLSADTYYYNVCNDIIFSSVKTGYNQHHYYSDDYGASFKEIGNTSSGYDTFYMLGYANGYYYYYYSTLSIYQVNIYKSDSYKSLSHDLVYTFNNVEHGDITYIRGTCYNILGIIPIYIKYKLDYLSSITMFDTINNNIKLSNVHPIDNLNMEYINWGNLGKSLLLTTTIFPSASCISHNYTHTLPNYNKRKAYIKIK